MGEGEIDDIWDAINADEHVPVLGRPGHDPVAGPVVGPGGLVVRAGMVGEDDGVDAQRRLPDVLLIAGLAGTIVLRAAQEVVRGSGGLDVNLGHGMAIEIPVHDLTECLNLPLEELVVERLVVLVQHDVAQLSGLLGKVEDARVCVVLNAPEEVSILQAVVGEPELGCVVHIEAVSLLEELGSVQVGCDIGDHLRAAIRARRERNGAEGVGAVVEAHAKHQLRRRGRALPPPALDQAGIGPPVGAAEDAAIGVQRHLEEEQVDEQPGLPADLGILGEVVEVDQRQQILLEVAVGQPFAEAEARAEIEPPADEVQRMLHMVAPILAVILEGALLEELTGQQLVGVEDDLVVLGMVTAPVVALWLVPPVLEPEQTYIDVGDELGRDARAVVIGVENAQQAADGEITAVVPRIDERDAFPDGRLVHRLPQFQARNLTEETDTSSRVLGRAELQVLLSTLLVSASGFRPVKVLHMSPPVWSR